MEVKMSPRIKGTCRRKVNYTEQRCRNGKDFTTKSIRTNKLAMCWQNTKSAYTHYLHFCSLTINNLKKKSGEQFHL